MLTAPSFSSSLATNSASYWLMLPRWCYFYVGYSQIFACDVALCLLNIQPKTKFSAVLKLRKQSCVKCCKLMHSEVFFSCWTKNRNSVNFHLVLASLEKPNKANFPSFTPEKNLFRALLNNLLTLLPGLLSAGIVAWLYREVRLSLMSH